MGEGEDLERKKKEFNEASIEIIRLIDSGNTDDAQKLYNLYTNCGSSSNIIPDRSLIHSKNCECRTN